jgi:hypothetical protein
MAVQAGFEKSTEMATEAKRGQSRSWSGIRRLSRSLSRRRWRTRFVQGASAKPTLAFVSSPFVGRRISHGQLLPVLGLGTGADKLGTLLKSAESLLDFSLVPNQNPTKE